MNLLPHGGLALAELEEHALQAGVKGLPITTPLRQGAIGMQKWNVLRADTSFPVAVLRHSALQHNLAWMKRFCEGHDVQLAPHGKTTMSPQLFGAQLANGAWGITLASATQVLMAQRFGVRRVLLANQLVAPADIASMLGLLHDDPAFELLALVDSPAGVQRLAAAVAAHPLARPLPLLVELGMAGKRAGCRSDEEAMALAHAVARAPGLQLAGFEGYEGLQVSADREADIAAVEAFLARLVALTCQADADQLFMGRGEIVLSAGGSGYFDLVARAFTGLAGNAALRNVSRPLVPILRSGCYLTSDHGSYLRQLGDLAAREAAHACADCGGDGAAQRRAGAVAPPRGDHGDMGASADRDERHADERHAAAPRAAAGQEQGAADTGADTEDHANGQAHARADHHAADTDGLRPALEVWSMVQSRPEPSLAILTMGKRDASYDIELPIPLLRHRPAADASATAAALPTAMPAGSVIFKMNDQHAYLRLPPGHEAALAVGDLVGCGISHPCTTFDKWPLLLVVDDAYTVQYAVNTFF